jgi:hypothetical protein
MNWWTIILAVVGSMALAYLLVAFGFAFLCVSIGSSITSRSDQSNPSSS